MPPRAPRGLSLPLTLALCLLTGLVAPPTPLQSASPQASADGPSFSLHAEPAPAVPPSALAPPDDAVLDRVDPAAVPSEQSDQATLETRQPDVQWSPAGAARWVSVPDRQAVAAGDRVRTGPNARAQLVYFEGTVTEVGPETGILVQRLERGGEGNVIASLFQAVGSTVSRVLPAGGAPADFQVETPAATAFVRGTTPRVEVAPDGSTRVANVPDEREDSIVIIRGKDPRQTEVQLVPGQETNVPPGLPPSAPSAIGSLPALTSVGAAAHTQTQQQQSERQQRRAEAQQRAEAAVSQAQAALAALESDLTRLLQQEQALIRDITGLLTLTPIRVGASTRQPSLPILRLDAATACATVPGQTCQVGGTLQGSLGTVVSSMSWQIVVPTGAVAPGAVATVFIPTTLGIHESFACPAAMAGAPTICTGVTIGNGLQGETVRVFLGDTLLAQGTINGPGITVTTVTPTRTPTIAATPTSTPTTAATPAPSPTATAAGTATPTATPSVTATMTIGAATPTATATPTASLTPTVVPTLTPTPSSTPTLTATATTSPTLAATPTLTATPTSTMPVPPPCGQSAPANSKTLLYAGTSNGCVAVVDAESNTVAGRVSLTTAPEALARHPQAPYLYVALPASNQVAVVDTNTNVVATRVPVGLLPTGLAVTPNGSRVYVANSGSTTVSVIDTMSHTVMATVTAVPSSPYGVAINPSGSRAYVTNSAGSTVRAIDTSSNTAAQTIIVGPQPKGIAAHPSDGRIFVVGPGSDLVWIIDTMNNNTVTVAELDAGAAPQAVAVSPDGAFLYVTLTGTGATPGNQVAVLTISQDVLLSTTVTVGPTGSRPVGVAVSADGLRVYVTNQNSNSLSVLDRTQNHALVTTVPLDASPLAVAARPLP